MKKYSFITAWTVAAALSAPLYAQEPDREPSETLSFEARRMEIVNQPWLLTGNAAGLSLIPVSENGYAHAGAERSVGNMHRAQQGGALNQFYFNADKFSKLNKYLYAYGSFGMDLSREYDRAWSDALNTYSGNPYIFGSGRKGDYDAQNYVLNAKLATTSLGKFTYGFDLKYNVGDLSRLRDPRPRNLHADYTVTPSATFAISPKSTVGANAYYRFHKQRMTGISTVEEDKYEYYDFQGLENHKVISTSGFNRRFVARHWGMALQYALHAGAVYWLTDAGFETMKEKVIDKELSSPGRYITESYKLASVFRYKAAVFTHTIDLKASYVDGNADAYTQERRTWINDKGVSSHEWITLYSALVYRDYKTDISLDYKFYNTAGADGYNWYLGLNGAYTETDNKYLLPRSVRNVSTYTAGLDFGIGILRGKEHRLFAEGGVKAWLPGNNELDLAADNILSQNVWVPDMEFLNKNRFGADLRFNYTFPLSRKGSPMRGVISLYGGHAFSEMKNPDGDRKTRSYVGLSFGILTL